MKYRTKIVATGHNCIVPVGTILHKAEAYPYETFWADVGGTSVFFSEGFVENNPDIFEPIHERLTSEEEDEAARRYMWVPKMWERVFRINIAKIMVENRYWSGNSYDWLMFRCGMIFKNITEADNAATLMKSARKSSG